MLFISSFSIYKEKGPSFRSVCNNIVLCNTAGNSLLCILQMSANEWKHRVGCWVPEEFICWTQLVLLPFSSHLHPFIHKTLPVAASYQRCCGKCSITSLLGRQPLTLPISCSQVVPRDDLDFVFTDMQC